MAIVTINEKEPNRETIRAIRNVKKGKIIKAKDVADLMRKLNS